MATRQPDLTLCAPATQGLGALDRDRASLADEGGVSAAAVEARSDELLADGARPGPGRSQVSWRGATLLAAGVFAILAGREDAMAESRTTSGAKRRSSRKRYGAKASEKVERAMHEMKRGKLRSGGSGRKVRSRKQAIAIGLSRPDGPGARSRRIRTRARAGTSRENAHVRAQYGLLHDHIRPRCSARAPLPGHP